jgi:hypothetical protein
MGSNDTSIAIAPLGECVTRPLGHARIDERAELNAVEATARYDVAVNTGGERPRSIGG